ncbi:MAG: polysaccharide biosynthesis protein, partial [Methanosarcinales archaeon]|nr:polysaccharide biosynthesis protein [Methanosarcinales archaeon]
MEKLQMEKLESFYEGKIILVTGGTGSIGKEIVKTLLNFNPKTIRVLDINETALFDLEQELNTHRIRAFLGDMRDKERLKRAIEDVDIVFHAAALKHVPSCEYNPFEAVKTNVYGTQNLIDVAIDEEVEKFIMISTDKAANPVNVMGATKLLAERLTISANLYKGKRKTVFSCVRFGNVLYSRGSVLPIFEEQIKDGFITLTDSNMTRFIMEISQAVKLTLKATQIAKCGEIFILKMPSIKIEDLANVLIEKLAPTYGYKPEDIKLKIIGKRVGEKLYEELMTEDEAENAWEDDEMLVVLPQINNIDDKLSHKLPDNFKRTQKKIYSSKSVKLLNK